MPPGSPERSRGGAFLRRSSAALLLAATAALGVASCDVETALRRVAIKLYQRDPHPPPPDVVVATPVAETDPVFDDTDAADDPAIWINPVHPARSWVIGTNKRRGVEVYDLGGKRRWHLDAGKINNVDLRGGVAVSGEERIVVAATNRTAGAIEVWALDAGTGQLASLVDEPVPAPMDDPYGLCLYHRKADGALFAFATDRNGDAVQWRLAEAGRGRLRGELVRRIALDSQSEGCVADDVTGALFIGEEAVGIWRLGAAPEAGDERTLIASTRPAAEAAAPKPDSPHRLTSDVEGLAIYAPPGAGPSAGYLVASSQGNWTYVVFDRAPPHAYRGTFRLADGAGSDGRPIDGVGDTDGVAVAAQPVGPAYPEGLLVVQDGHNVDAAGEHAHQNFKYVSWADVAGALGLDS